MTPPASSSLLASRTGVPPTTHLLDILRRHAGDVGLTERIDPPPTQRSWLRLTSTEESELWLISWPAGTSTGWHDHGPALGAFTVIQGDLVEHSWDGALQLRDLGQGDVRAFGAGHVHDVRNVSSEPALSLHAYAPRLEAMTRYRFLGDRVEVVALEEAGVAW